MDEGIFFIKHLGDMYKHRLPKGWNFFFHATNPSFAPEKGGLHGISGLSQILGYFIANNLYINYDKLPMSQILSVIRPLAFESFNLLVLDISSQYSYNLFSMMFIR